MSFFGKIFEDCSIYSAAIPTYIGGIMAFGWGTDDIGLRKNPLKTIENRFKNATLSTKYYNPSVHVGSFAIPTYIAKNIKDQK